MVSIDERREVAARLRDYAKRDFEESNPWWYLSKAMTGSFAAYDDVGEYFIDLADLIEPKERTCDMELCDTGEWFMPECREEYLMCSNCKFVGYYVQVSEDADYWCEKPKYCPNCGAKVVD